MATLLLAEAGAEVVKIERPGSGEEMRGYVPRWGADSVNFAMLNRGKKSVALDLKDPDQRPSWTPWSHVPTLSSSSFGRVLCNDSASIMKA